MDKTAESGVSLPPARAAERPAFRPGRWGHIADQGAYAENRRLDARKGGHPGRCSRRSPYRHVVLLCSTTLAVSWGRVRPPSLAEGRKHPPGRLGSRPAFLLALIKDFF